MSCTIPRRAETTEKKITWTDRAGVERTATFKLRPLSYGEFQAARSASYQRSDEIRARRILAARENSKGTFDRRLDELLGALDVKTQNDHERAIGAYAALERVLASFGAPLCLGESIAADREFSTAMVRLGVLAHDLVYGDGAVVPCGVGEGGLDDATLELYWSLGLLHQLATAVTELCEPTAAEKKDSGSSSAETETVSTATPALPIQDS